MVAKFACVVVAAIACLKGAESHGMMLEPPNRASLWRFDWTQPAEYNDNEFFCGGVPAQYGQNGGKCGVCGDNWADPRPRRNENTGVFGNGIVLRTYPAGSIVTTSVTLTANHQGTFNYSLCVLDDPSQPEPEDCFHDLQLADGSDQYHVGASDYTVENQVQLPPGVTCERCVFRWHYTSGNSWGVCRDGTERVGCGAQETFRSCADITIV